jgi:hypothetical protein
MTSTFAALSGRFRLPGTVCDGHDLDLARDEKKQSAPEAERENRTVAFATRCIRQEGAMSWA